MCGADWPTPSPVPPGNGSPPRVRSRRLVSTCLPYRVRITSACAEQTVDTSLTPGATTDHLRVCGADADVGHRMQVARGSPPRVRSRQTPCFSWELADGITSACAEQTSLQAPATCSPRDHLRVCGADSLMSACMPTVPGSPPRVRSRRIVIVSCRLLDRITSACAEQTSPNPTFKTQAWDHLRVCGADLNGEAADPKAAGSPPRVRSRLTGYPSKGYSLGITSACAEQTMAVGLFVAGAGDHLRVCGADNYTSGRPYGIHGSPPRVRSRRNQIRPPTSVGGITSACAEQTDARTDVGISSEDHLRVCGADAMPRSRAEPDAGSPPRVRSRLV